MCIAHRLSINTYRVNSECNAQDGRVTEIKSSDIDRHRVYEVESIRDNFITTDLKKARSFIQFILEISITSTFAYKFRSMFQDAEKLTGPIMSFVNDKRITKFGSFIRKTRIDELPQLWNVLKGDMSFVGPRPERPVFVDKFEKQIPFYIQRFSLRPGITGWAQIRCPYASTIEQTVDKLRYELYYLKNFSLLFDFTIILRTIKVVLFAKGT